MRDHVIVYVLLLTLVCYLQQGMFNSVVVYTEVGSNCCDTRLLQFMVTVTQYLSQWNQSNARTIRSCQVNQAPKLGHRLC